MNPYAQLADASLGRFEPGPRVLAQWEPPVDRNDPRFFDWSWAFILSEVDGQSTRLITRVRADFRARAVMALIGTVVFGPVDFVLSRKMLQGIRWRAERSAMKAA